MLWWLLIHNELFNDRFVKNLKSDLHVSSSSRSEVVTAQLMFTRVNSTSLQNMCICIRTCSCAVFTLVQFCWLKFFFLQKHHQQTKVVFFFFERLNFKNLGCRLKVSRLELCISCMKHSEFHLLNNFKYLYKSWKKNKIESWLVASWCSMWMTNVSATGRWAWLQRGEEAACRHQLGHDWDFGPVTCPEINTGRAAFHTICRSLLLFWDLVCLYFKYQNSTFHNWQYD